MGRMTAPGEGPPHAAERGGTPEATRDCLRSKEERDEKVAKYYAAQGAQQSLDSLAAYVAALAGSQSSAPRPGR